MLYVALGCLWARAHGEGNVCACVCVRVYGLRARVCVCSDCVRGQSALVCGTHRCSHGPLQA
eukprot:7208670-Alexandrium_andersonii.AAC.1